MLTMKSPQEWGGMLRGIKLGAMVRAVLWFMVLAATSLFCGLLCAVLPWLLGTKFGALLIVGLVGAVVYGVTIWNMPWLGLFLYILIVLFAPDVKVADLATVGTMGVFFLRGLLDHEHIVAAIDKNLRLPLALLMGIILFSSLLGVFYFKSYTPFIYRDARIFLYWGWIPLVSLWLHGDRDGTKKIDRLLVGIALLVALMTLFEAVTGLQIIATGRVGSLETAGADQSSLTRVQMPGFIFMLWALTRLVVALPNDRKQFMESVVPAFIIICGLVVTFGRALWVWSFVSIAISVLLINYKKALRLIVFGSILGSLFLIGAIAVKPHMVDAVIVRLTSVGSEGGRVTSYGLRQWENENAVARLKSSPVVGVGMGGEYRNHSRLLNLFEDHTRYIHNSYLFLSLKIGIPGMLLLLYILTSSWLFAVRRVYKRDMASSALIAAIAALPATLGLSITQPELMTPASVIFFCFLVHLLRPSQTDSYLLATSNDLSGAQSA